MAAGTNVALGVVYIDRQAPVSSPRQAACRPERASGGGRNQCQPEPLVAAASIATLATVATLASIAALVVAAPACIMSK